MRRNQIIPRRGDGKDVGFKWVRGSKMLHYYRTRAGASMAVSHCGIISSTDLLEEPIKIVKCVYCEMIENMRDKDETDE